jgi:hypothetical protein
LGIDFPENEIAGYHTRLEQSLVDSLWPNQPITLLADSGIPVKLWLRGV